MVSIDSLATNLTQKKSAEDQKQQESDTILNSFNYFCLFCLRLTLMDNKGNYSVCHECGIYGSNFGA